MNSTDEAGPFLPRHSAERGRGVPKIQETIATLVADPTQPRNLHNPGKTYCEVWLTWDPPVDSSDLLGYEISCPGRELVNTTLCEYIDRGLTPEVEYVYQVTPYRGDGNPPGTPHSILVVTRDRVPPTKPRAFKASGVTHNSAELSWGASESHSGEIFYLIYLNGVLRAETKQLTYTISCLKDLAVYHVRIGAVIKTGTKRASRFASLEFKTLLRPPILKFSQRNGVGRLAWAPYYWNFPSHEGTISGHAFSTGPGRLSFKFKLAEVTSGPVPLHLEFSVRAKLGDNYSEASNLEAVVDDILPPNQPGIPVLSNITDTSATLAWAPSSDNKGVTAYKIRCNLVTKNVSLTTTTFTQLKRGVWYLATVRAEDEAGNVSVPSEVWFQTTGVASKPRPTPPIDINIVHTSSTSVEINWSFEHAGTGVLGVVIKVDDEYLDPVLEPHYQKQLENLVPGTEYSITLITLNWLNGQFSEPTTLTFEQTDTAPPSVPGRLRIISSTPDSATLAWDESTDDIGMYGYVIYNNHEYVDSTTLGQYTAVDLVPGFHLFEVVAVDAFGNTSEPALVGKIIGGPEDVTPPSVPRNFRVTFSAPALAVLTWEESTDDVCMWGYAVYLDKVLLDTQRGTYRQYHPLSAGVHLFEVRALDIFGNASEPASVQTHT
ncbi:fibronectin type III domain-containing protein [Pseudomonas sp. Z1-14]|uniref:fibronectin type III domain-containing protein n=1 Tax=Pseudomonas sp. Z1-14 TaxID=2817409 RepID=UPI003DA9F9BE